LSPFFLAGPAGATDAPAPHPLEVFPISGLTYAKKQEITTTSRGLAAARWRCRRAPSFAPAAGPPGSSAKPDRHRRRAAGRRDPCRNGHGVSERLKILDRMRGAGGANLNGTCNGTSSGLSATGPDFFYMVDIICFLVYF